MTNADGNVAAADRGIELRQVCKRFGGPGAPWVLDHLDLVVPRGTLTALLGPSGCGKTTLLRLVAGLDDLTSGSLLIDGRDVRGLGAAERSVSMVFQSYALFPHMDVAGNVGYGLRVSGMNAAQAAERIQATLERVGLGALARRMPGELSGGQQQRVAVARALVLEPSVMLFDEPLSNLDARLRRSMRDEIRRLQQELGLTVAYVTHDQAEALAVADQVVVMDQGRVAQAGCAREIYERPASAFVAGFMGEAMLFDAMAREDGRIELGPLTLSLRQPVAAGAVKLAVRPQAWTLAGGALPAHGQWMPARVKFCAYLGSLLEVTLECALGTVFVVSTDTARHWSPGEDARLSLSGAGVSVVPA